MSRVKQLQSLEFGATEPRLEGFDARESLFSGLFSFGRMFGSKEDVSAQADLSLPKTIGEVPHSQSLAPSMATEPVSSDQSVVEKPAQMDEMERLVLHVAASDRPAQASRILVTHLPSLETPLGALDCAAFASRFARALSLEGRAILVILGEGSGRRLGLSDLVAGTASFSEAIHRETGSRLHILPPGHSRVAPGAHLGVVMEALAETYDFLVLAILDEDREAARSLALSLAPRADHAVIGCAGQMGAPDLVEWRETLLAAGAGDVLAARMGGAGNQEEMAA